eukprot:TRINITY_DN798_c0_g1_i2.p1 TRINITY_DN798_c0_g1~~TRINITY_DN798_c0_g1_i2.p1  ORF type:complete len:185 (+),score=31.94 TRINITY_DN798_c0_g1_i2:52-555(+)
MVLTQAAGALALSLATVAGAVAVAVRASGRKQRMREARIRRLSRDIERLEQDSTAHRTALELKARQNGEMSAQVVELRASLATLLSKVDQEEEAQRTLEREVAAVTDQNGRLIAEKARAEAQTNELQRQLTLQKEQIRKLSVGKSKNSGVPVVRTTLHFRCRWVRAG